MVQFHGFGYVLRLESVHVIDNLQFACFFDCFVVELLLEYFVMLQSGLELGFVVADSFCCLHQEFCVARPELRVGLNAQFGFDRLYGFVVLICRHLVKDVYASAVIEVGGDFLVFIDEFADSIVVRSDFSSAEFRIVS